jgi:hypothetical protein
LYVGGFNGSYYDLSNGATLFSDTARTTPAVVGGPVRGISDLAPANNPLTTSTTTFVRRVNGVEGPPGVASFVGFVNTAIPEGSAAGWTSAVAVKPGNPLNAFQWMDMDSPTLRLAQNIFTDGNVDSFGWVPGSTLRNAHLAGGVVAGVPIVIVAVCTPTSLTLRVNKVQVAQATWASSVPVNGATPMSLFAGYEGLATPNNRPCGNSSQMMAAVFVGKPCSPAEIDNLENWLTTRAV